MNSSTFKLLVSGMLLLLLSACAPYHQTYYPANGGYGVTQGSYYGGYPYRHDNHSSPYNSKYRYDDRHDSYNSRPSWNNRYVRPNPPNDYRYNHNDRRHQQFGSQGFVPKYPDRKNHNDLPRNNNWSKPPSDRRWGHNNPQHGRPNPDGHSYRQYQRPDDRRNQIREQRHYNHENDNRDRHEDHQQSKSQRESRRGDTYQ
ncbi:MAG: hypothetical protein LUO94_07980 [Methylococcaceae bacterium]|nr:hypothetical protein [Methylococcaceae bacterium]